MLVVVPEAGLESNRKKALNLQTLEKMVRKSQMPSTLAFSVPFITGLVLILDLKNMPSATSDDVNSYFNHLSAVNIWHLHRVSLISLRLPGHPEMIPAKGIFTLLAQHTCRFIQFSSNLFRATPWGTTIQSFFDYVGVSQHSVPSIPFLFH